MANEVLNDTSAFTDKAVDTKKAKTGTNKTLEIDVNQVEGRTKDSYKPDGFESQEAFLLDMRETYSADLIADKTNRDQALDDKKFSAGEQWDPVVLEQRKGLPCLVINSIPQFTAQLVGDWRESKKAIKVVPSNDEDVDVASIRGDIIRAIEMQSRADRVYDSAFESLIQCGDGAFRVSVEYARDDVFDQDIFIRPIEDCLATVWDRFSVDPTGRDARHVFVDDRMPKKEFCRKYSDVQPTELMSTDAFKDMTADGWADQDSYRVTEYWRMIERERLIGLFSNNKIYELTAENTDEILAANGSPVKTRVAKCSYAQMHLVTGFAILAGPFEYRLSRLPIIRMSGRIINIGGRRVRHGIVRFMKDSVRLKNFWRSITAEQLGYAPKAKWIAPESAVEGREDAFRKAHLSRDPLLVYNDGAESPPELIPPPPVDAAALNQIELNAQDMKDVTGIHDASLGIRSNETSGRAIQARQREGDIAQLAFYDNGNASVLEGGDVINQLIPQIMDGTRVLLGLGEDEKQKFYRVNDPMDPNSVDLSVGQFHVALSTGTSYSTRRVEAGQAMMDAIQVYPQLMQIAGPEIIRAQDWPGAEKIAEIMEQARGQPQIDPAELQKLQESVQKLSFENQALKADKSYDEQKLIIDAYKAKTDRIKALSDHEVDNNKMEMDAIARLLDTSAKLDDHEVDKAKYENDDARSREESERSHQLEQKKLESSIAKERSTASKTKTQPRKSNG
jgi:hypothetical protein